MEEKTAVYGLENAYGYDRVAFGERLCGQWCENLIL